MPDKDITLGEVYRAVLGVREELHVIRSEFTESQQRLRDDSIKYGLNIRENEVRIEMLEARLAQLDRQKNDAASLVLRVQNLENAGSPKASDPWARIGSIISALAAGAAAWFAKG